MKRRLTTFLGIVTAMVVAVGGAALASEAVEDIVDDGEETTLTRPVVEVDYDEDVGGVMISINTDGDDPCEGLKLDRDPDTGEVILVPDDTEADPDATVDPDAPADPDETTEYPGCLPYDSTAEDGKVNNGTMQSIVARNLSPHDLDIPKGWIMREVAKVKPMKVKAKDALKDDEPEFEDDEFGEDEAKNKDKDDKGPKGKAKGHDREKKGKGARGG